MLSVRKVVILAPVCCLIPFDVPASAGEVQFDFKAVVVDVRDPAMVFGDCFHDGDLLTGHYCFDAVAVDRLPEDPAWGWYECTTRPSGIQIWGGARTFRTDPWIVDFAIEIQDNAGSPPEDLYNVVSYNNYAFPALPAGATIELISWSLRDPAATAVSCDVLPTIPPDLNAWPGDQDFQIQAVRRGEATAEGTVHARVTAIELHPATAPVGEGSAEPRLSLRYPDESVSGIEIRFEIPGVGSGAMADTHLAIYGVDGRVLRTLAHGVRPAGRHSVIWDGRDDHGHRLSPGVYFVHVDAGGIGATERVVMLPSR